MKNSIEKICGCVDHTNLKKTALPDDIIRLCEEAIKYNAASVCVQPCYVELASVLLEGKNPAVCTVIGFPNGYSTTKVKEAETIDAILNGATEIDMVLNINWLKSGMYDKIRNEIKTLADICHHRYESKKAILKVIVETCLLTSEEIQKMVELCIEGEADFIKTSTGFDSAGAQIEDIKLMKDSIMGRYLKIKASGGIRTLEDADAMIEAGADRIGASALFKEIK